MAKYETIKAEEIRYGNNNFIEVALKKVIGDVSGEQPRFVSISKGWYPAEAEDPNVKRFKTGIGFPADKEILEKFKAAIGSIESATEATAEKAEEPTPAEPAAEEAQPEGEGA